MKVDESSDIHYCLKNSRNRNYRTEVSQQMYVIDIGTLREKITPSFNCWFCAFQVHTGNQQANKFDQE